MYSSYTRAAGEANLGPRPAAGQPHADAGTGEGRRPVTSDELVRDLAARGWRAAVVPAARLGDLRGEIESRRVRGGRRRIMDGRRSQPRLRGARRAAAPRSLIVVAVPHACARVTVMVDGEALRVPIPTTYCHHDEIQAEVAAAIARAPGAGRPRGGAAVAAREAAGRLRRPGPLRAQHIAYVDGCGSFVRARGLRVRPRARRRPLDRPARS